MEFGMTESKAKEFIQTFTDPERAKRALIKINEGQQFGKAIDHPIGKMLLDDALKRREELLLKLIENIGGDEIVDHEARIEYKIINGILGKWAGKVANYIKDMEDANFKIIKGRK